MLREAPNDDVSPVVTRPEGLSEGEAAARLRQCGPNTIRDAPTTPWARRLLANFTHLMALLLWAGGLVGLVAQMPQLGIAIWMVNLINGSFSFWQEYRAGRATTALRRMLPRYALVVRDGVERRVLAEALVPGDILVLAEGDHISADARLIEDAELWVDQSALTGESVPVSKSSAQQRPSADDPLPASSADTPNLVFAGTSVTSGRGRAVIEATGMRTQLGSIAHLTQDVVDEPSPLQQELGRVTRFISVLAIGIGVLFFVLAIAVAGVSLSSGFVFAMGMIVAFVPEGMLPTVTLSLAMGVQRMARRHALVKRLSAVETLGCTTVICTDKTGTLTQNEMMVREVWLPGLQYTVDGTGYAPDGELRNGGIPITTPAEGDLRLLLRVAFLCTDAQLVPPRERDRPPAHWTALGDPTEAAIQALAMKGGIDLAAETRAAPRLAELPFDSHRKRMATIHGPDGDGHPFLCTKGAVHELVAECTHLRRNGRDAPLELRDQDEIFAANDRFAAAGLRVLAIAYRAPLALPSPAPGPRPYPAEIVERELTFLGLLAMYDPPRPEVAEAVARCHAAGIRIVMITGDYGLTAESIARQIGIIRGGPVRVLTGAELEVMTDTELQEALRDEVVVARATPEHKLRVVATLQSVGHVVAVTGDGVNDAPALKQADIGVAMGLGGTDVAREAADMILTDDNFASIVNAVEEGRTVFANIRKFATYVFNSNAAEAVPFILLLFSRGAIPLPLTVMQVLAIDLGTDMVPAMGLGAERPEPGVMDRPPRSQAEPLLNRALLLRAFLWYGALESVASIAGYFFLNWRNGWPGVPLATEGTIVYQMATTMTLAGVVAGQIGAVFGCRTDRRSVFQLGLFTNRLILIGIVVEVVLLGLLVWVPPLQSVFNTAPLGPIEWLFVLAWAPIILFADEARKLLLRRLTPHLQA